MPGVRTIVAVFRVFCCRGGVLPGVVRFCDCICDYPCARGLPAFIVSSMWRKCIFLVIKYIRFEDLLDYVHFVTKPLFYRHFAGVQQEPLFQVFVNQVRLCVFSAGLLLKGKVFHEEVRMCGSCRCR